MAEQQSSRQFPSPLGSVHKSDSKLRLVGADGNVVIPEHAEQTDSAPTIISKKAQATAAASEALIGKNLRGQRLAHFELLEPIGVGGMAAVMRARDTQLDRFVALKILPPEMAEDGENIRRFHQEARAAAKLDHANIAKVFFCGEDRNLHFIAFEFVEGDNLRTILERRGRIPVPEAILYISQIATGLDHAASRGVVHRDIKPSNIIITPTGGAKLVDMGLARSLGPTGDQALTQSGMTLGTFDYISPEQALEPREADVRSDIYSLGCTFYHMVTGQPPVPEGTAAKKLHHHQHVAPIDPRQLDANIPDDVAAILMKMMCKDPKQRYQNPVQLVQHLLQVAQRVGAGANVPEGAMFVDAPLPGAPRFRPVLTMGLAGAALAVLLLLVSLAPEPKPPVLPKGTEEKPLVLDGPKPQPQSPDKQLLPGDFVLTSSQFDGALRQEMSEIKIVDSFEPRAGSKCDLTGNKQMTLKSQNAKFFPVLRWKNQTTSGDLLTFSAEKGCSVTLENIIFEVVAGESSLTNAMISLRGPGQFIFKKCSFVQNGKGANGPTVLISGGDAQYKPQVTFDQCFFEQGYEAVCVQGPAQVTANNCAFGPHNSLFHCRGDSKKFDATTLYLWRCSAFLNGPVFRLDNEFRCSLNVTNSLFTNIDATNPGNEVQLIRQADSGERLVKYEGNKNRYYNLKGFWATLQDPGQFDLTSFINDLSESGPGSKETESLLLTEYPWQEKEPLRLLHNDAKLAFQVRKDSEDVRISSKGAVGIRDCVWGRMEDLPLLAKAIKPAPPVQPKLNENDRVVDPDELNPPPGYFRTVAEAARSMTRGGVLFIKHGNKNRDVPIEGVVFEKQIAAYDITVKPYQDHQPVLVFSSKPLKRGMFTQQFDGKLSFENLEFYIAPDQPELKWQSVVALASDGQCSFKNCLFTLKRADRKIHASVITLLDQSDDMKMPNAPAREDARKVTFNDCLVRGEGDLAYVSGNQPLELIVDNSSLALDGSLLSVSNKPRDKDEPLEGKSSLRLTKVSAFLKDPFINLHGSKTASALGLVPIRFEPVRDNLFVALEKQPFIAVEGNETDKNVLRQLIDWKGDKNAYVGLETMYEGKNAMDWSTMTLLNRNAWTELEREPLFPDAAFTMPPSTSLSDLPFDHFKVQQAAQKGLANYGAALDMKMFPRPR